MLVTAKTALGGSARCRSSSIAPRSPRGRGRRRRCARVGKARLRQRAPVAGDALRDVLEMLECVSSAMSRWPRPIEMARRRIAAGLAIGGHRVEAMRAAAAVEQHRRRQPRRALGGGQRDHRFVVRRHDYEAVDAARDQRFDAPALDGGVFARRDQQQIVGVRLGQLLDAATRLAKNTLVMSGTTMPTRREDLERRARRRGRAGSRAPQSPRRPLPALLADRAKRR